MKLTCLMPAWLRRLFRKSEPPLTDAEIEAMVKQLGRGARATEEALIRRLWGVK